jgi:hypothetical protein
MISISDKRDELQACPSLQKAPFNKKSQNQTNSRVKASDRETVPIYPARPPMHIIHMHQSSFCHLNNELNREDQIPGPPLDLEGMAIRRHEIKATQRTLSGRFIEI